MEDPIQQWFELPVCREYLADIGYGMVLGF
jgi:hypothetical protein